MKIALATLCVTPLILLAGCESSAPPEAAAQATALEGSAPPDPAPASAASAPADDAQQQPAAAPADASAAPAAAPAPPSDGPKVDPAIQGLMMRRNQGTPPPANPQGTSETAAVGVGAKGRDYGGPGFVTTPIETLFTVEQRIAFEVQIPKAMSLYKAAHDNKGPKTQEEYMEVIIKEHGVQLPDLPAGDVYWYDPKTEELMVRHPTGQ